ncbi:MAG: hypothetical protein H0U15_05615, partial [Geodermatophilaceae bacterium]|nr:hypothetical protein [Geodermatophilaceae bacterium]
MVAVTAGEIRADTVRAHVGAVAALAVCALVVVAAVFAVSVAVVQVVHMVLVDHGFVSAFWTVGVAVVLGGAVVGRG